MDAEQKTCVLAVPRSPRREAQAIFDGTQGQSDLRFQPVSNDLIGNYPPERKMRLVDA